MSEWKKTRVRVRESHSIGSHPLVWDRTSIVALGTVKRWFTDYRRRCGVYGRSVMDLDANGYGSVTFHYYVSGCPNNHRFEIEPADAPNERIEQ